MKKKVIAVIGPTASGKSAIAIEIANKFNGEIVNMDSMQIYRHMDIGTAKPTKQEMQSAPHHLFDIVDPAETFSVSEYKTLALEVINDIILRGKVPILTGGTGLYLSSLYYDLDLGGSKRNKKDELETILENEGKEGLFNVLKGLSAEAAGAVGNTNSRRMIRAIELLRQGKDIGKFSEAEKNPAFDFLLIGTNRERQLLYDRINQRVDIMLSNGLVKEVKKLVDLYSLDDTYQSMKGIGYKEVLNYLNNKENMDDSVEILKRNSRRYAKRQLTWFRNQYDDVNWFDLSDNVPLAEIESLIKVFLQEG